MLAGEGEERHVGPAPWAVDREETQPGARQPVEVGVGVGHQLVGLLGGGVERQRVVDVVVDRERHRGVGAVDRARRGVDQVRARRWARQPSRMWRKPTRLRVDVGVRVDERVADAGLGGEVDDAVEAVAGEQAVDRQPVAEVEPDELEPEQPPKLGEPGLLQRHVVVVVEVVEAEHGAPGQQQAPGEVKADEPGDAGDQSRHALIVDSLDSGFTPTASRRSGGDGGCPARSPAPFRQVDQRAVDGQTWWLVFQTQPRRWKRAVFAVDALAHFFRPAGPGSHARRIGCCVARG